jgi:hypothetical protein
MLLNNEGSFLNLFYFHKPWTYMNVFNGMKIDVVDGRKEEN